MSTADGTLESELREVMERYCALRRRIDAGEAPWSALADFYTDDVVYIDPAWGRVEGLEEVRAFFDESMRGLEDWRFPIEVVAVAGDTAMVRWLQVLPGARPDGRPYSQPGISTMHYAGGGRFDHQEDLLNMVHVLEDLRASGWRPGPGFVAPPAEPDRRFERRSEHRADHPPAPQDR